MATLVNVQSFMGNALIKSSTIVHYKLTTLQVKFD